MKHERCVFWHHTLTEWFRLDSSPSLIAVLVLETVQPSVSIFSDTPVTEDRHHKISTPTASTVRHGDWDIPPKNMGHWMVPYKNTNKIMSLGTGRPMPVHFPILLCPLSTCLLDGWTRLQGKGLVHVRGAFLVSICREHCSCLLNSCQNATSLEMLLAFGPGNSFPFSLSCFYCHGIG